MVTPDVAKELIKKHKLPRNSKTQQAKASLIAQQSATNSGEALVLPESQGSQPKQATSNLMALSATHQLTLQQNELQQLVARDSYKAQLEAAQSANQQLSLLIAFCAQS